MSNETQVTVEVQTVSNLTAPFEHQTITRSSRATTTTYTPVFKLKKYDSPEPLMTRNINGPIAWDAHGMPVNYNKLIADYVDRGEDLPPYLASLCRVSSYVSVVNYELYMQFKKLGKVKEFNACAQRYTTCRPGEEDYYSAESDEELFSVGGEQQEVEEQEVEEQPPHKCEEMHEIEVEQEKEDEEMEVEKKNEMVGESLELLELPESTENPLQVAKADDHHHEADIVDDVKHELSNLSSIGDETTRVTDSNGSEDEVQDEGYIAHKTKKTKKRSFWRRFFRTCVKAEM